MSTAYLESSALLLAVLQGDERLEQDIAGQDRLVSSTLTFLEVQRVLLRAMHNREISPDAYVKLRRQTEDIELSCLLRDMDAQVLARARQPFLVEPVVYSTQPGVPKQSAAFAAQRPALVIETARRIGALGADVLKVEFPHDARFNDDEGAWVDGCAALNEAAPVPWALLSAGVDYQTFKRQVRVVCQAGASGFVAGRAIWKEALTMAGEERETFLRSSAADRMAELSELVEAYGRPWTAHYPGLASAAGNGWLTRYAEARA